MSQPRAGQEYLQQRWKHSQAMLNAYGCLPPGASEYLKTHWRRYLYTLELLPMDRPLRVLEVGACAPFGFTMLLAEHLPDAKVVLAHEPFRKDSATVLLRSKDPDFPTRIFESRGFNVELETWPFEDGSFDVVLFMEVLEHLVADPFFVFVEAHRVLAEGGQFIVTTPNIACYQSLQAILEGRSPYTYGVYSVYGSSGRHNREYVCNEVDALGTHAGFERKLLTTRNFYEPEYQPPPALMNAIATYHSDRVPIDELRGQTTVYVGSKKLGNPGEYPHFLYDSNPRRHLCSLQLLAEHRGVPGKLTVKVRATNAGDQVWKTSRADQTRLGLQVLDGYKNVLALDHMRCDFPHDVNPGECVDCEITVDLLTVSHGAILRLDVVHENVCWFGQFPRNRPLDLLISDG